MQVSRQTHRDGVGISRGFLSLVYFIGLWFYCNNFTDHFICNTVLMRIILSVLAR